MPGETNSRGWLASRRRVAAAIFLGLVAVYFCNFRLRGAGDSFPTRVLPFSILREGNVDLNEFSWAVHPERPYPYYIRAAGSRKDRRYYSVSPIATSLVVTPLYVLPAAWLAWNDVDYSDTRARVVFVLMERLSAAVLTALSALVLNFVLCRLTTERWALALTLLYALGTSTFSISSQALWSHALAQLCLVSLCWLFIDRPLTARTMLAAGLVCLLMVANRPQMAIFAALALVCVLVRNLRHSLPVLVAGALFGAAVVGYNYWAHGHLIGAYRNLDHFSTPFVEGLTGIAVSPNRGLFIYTPVAIFAVWGAVQAWRRKADLWIRLLVAGIGAHVVMHAKFDGWWGGFTYGPRYFTDVMPALTILLVYGVVPYWRNAGLRAVVTLLAVYGVFVQAVGVYAADDDWNRTPVSVDTRPERLWDWEDTQIGRALDKGFKPFELLPLYVDTFRDPLAARLEQLMQADLRGQIEIDGAPASMRRGETTMLEVTVTNRSTSAWPAFSGKGMIDIRYLVFLVETWRIGDRQLNGVGEVMVLPENLAPGESVVIDVPLQAPPAPGVFTVDFRVSQAVDATRGVVSPDGAALTIHVR